MSDRNRVTYESDVKYFYTTNYPHRWGSGPVMNEWNPDTHDYLQNLEEAKAAAEAKAVGGHGEDRCDTTYGVVYKANKQAIFCIGDDIQSKKHHYYGVVKEIIDDTHVSVEWDDAHPGSCDTVPTNSLKRV